MKRKRFSVEHIMATLREANVALSQGQTVCLSLSDVWEHGADRLPLAE